MHQVNARSAIPAEYAANAKCFAASNENYLAPPDAIELEGAIRKVTLSSSLGRVELRWQRQAEKLFGKTPERAVVDALRTASRALKQSGFPASVRTLFMDWNILFLDEELPETHIPAGLVSNCHPAWMTPPANIYVVAQRVAAGCGSQQSMRTSEADEKLAEVLLHEIGHAIEFQLLKPRFGGDKLRAEGFATWFEQFAAEHSQVIPSGKLRREQLDRARYLLSSNRLGAAFSGDSDSYVAAALPFYAVVERKRVFGLMEIYNHIQQKGLSFSAALQAETGWSSKRLTEEVLAVIESGGKQ